MPQTQQWQWIPTHLTLEQFEQFVLPHLHLGCREPSAKAPFARHLQLYFETVVPRLSVERTAHRAEQTGAAGNPLHSDLRCLSAL